MTDPIQVLREAQEQHETLGPFFKAMHEYVDRTIDRFYESEPLPHPVLTASKDGSRLGHYAEMDAHAFAHRININVWRMRTGRDAAETATHELVHLWQHLYGTPCRNNYHGKEFTDKLAECGIIARPPRGNHIGYTDDNVWNQWMLLNEDLQLEQYILPGMNAKPQRQLIVLRCPGCGARVRSRRKLNIYCLDCDERFKVHKTKNQQRN